MKDGKSLPAGNKQPANSTAIYTLLILLSFYIGYFYAASSSSTADNNNNNLPNSQLPTTTATTAAMTLPAELDNFRASPNCAANPLPTRQIRQTLIDRVYGGTSPFSDFPPPHVAGSLRHKCLKGWGSTTPVFRHLLEEVRPEVIIEVGTFLGASTVHMAKLARELGLDDTVILCIDDFRGWAGFREEFPFIKQVNGAVTLLYQFMQNAVYTNVTDSVLPLPFSAGSTLSVLCEWGVTADLIEIDAGHEFTSIWSDLNRAYRLLRPGGVMFGHDYFLVGDRRSVRRAVHLFAQMYGHTVQIDGQHWVLRTS
ncbi:unnamed protein product [Linum tenue]|uniref:S-adenosyl-L-methionine-dependent methyltransferase n=1 Tax=Linum tenue TaxID=586396 RepID=A0AAV0HP88_9ROSI|nr:unnamed protein product [Linum tenue]